MKNTKRYIQILFSLPLIACMLLNGCAPQQNAIATPQPIAIPTATPELQPVMGGELILPMPRNPFLTAEGTTVTALNMNTEEMKNFFTLVYDSFLRCDVNNRIVPGLAEKWSVDETGKIWTFQLRENVVWHTGEDLLDSDDVLHTINSIMAYGSESYYFPLLNEYMSAAEKVDDKTVRITMKDAGGASLYALLFPVLRTGDAADVKNGTGPYQISRATENMVELTANMRWWRQTPYITTVRFFARESNDVALDSYAAGQLNMVPTSDVAAGKYREQGVTNVLDMYTQDCEVLLVNHNNTILGSLEIRKAIAHGIDRGALVSNVYMNRAAVSDVPVPPDSFLYDPTSKIYDFDRAKANAILDEAGWTQRNVNGTRIKDGRTLSFTLVVNDSTESTYRKSAADMVAAQLAQIGMDITVETEKLSIGEANSSLAQRLQLGEFDLAMVGFYLERSGNIHPYIERGGKCNYGGYANDALVALADRAIAAIEEKDMRETHSALQLAFVQDLPFITMYFRMSSLVYSAKIQDVSNVRGSDVLRTAYRWFIDVQA